MSRAQAPRKPKTKSFRSLSDPKTLSELAQRLKEGIYITTLEGEIVDANPAFLEMFGVESLDELKGFRTSDFVKPEVRAREMALLESEGSVRDIEFQLTRRDGEVRTVVDSAFLSVDRKTGEKYCHGILVDITQRKELQTQLLELSIRDPLTGCYNRRYLNTVTQAVRGAAEGRVGVHLSRHRPLQAVQRHERPRGGRQRSREDGAISHAARSRGRSRRSRWRGRVPGRPMRLRFGSDRARSVASAAGGTGVGARSILNGVGRAQKRRDVRGHDDPGRSKAARGQGRRTARPHEATKEEAQAQLGPRSAT